jgi:hypothetical protein
MPRIEAVPSVDPITTPSVGAELAPPKASPHLPVEVFSNNGGSIGHDAKEHGLSTSSFDGVVISDSPPPPSDEIQVFVFSRPALTRDGNIVGETLGFKGTPDQYRQHILDELKRQR